MKATRVLFASCLAPVCFGAQIIMSGSGTKAGIHFVYQTRVEPEIPGQTLEGFRAGGIIAGQGFHRYMTDSTTKRYFGYDLAIEPDTADRFRLTLRPLSLTPERLGLKSGAGWTEIPLPLLPAPQVVRAHDTIALDLFVHPGTGQKIVDYLSIRGRSTGETEVVEGPPVAMRLPEGAPRDFTVEDAPMKFAGVKGRIGESAIDHGLGSISGSAVYLYVPGRGRYIFSLAMNEQLGFKKAGEVRGSRLSASSGSERIDLQCNEPIAPGGGVFNVYLYHDAGWRPRSGADEPQMGASSARALVGR
jgi:hypothetical protein